MQDKKNKEITERQKIVNYLLDLIEHKKVDFKTPLPSEYFLVTKFKVSRGTVRSAFSDLKTKGLIKSEKGAGYFINPDFSFNRIKSIRNQLFTNKQEVFIKTELDTSNLVAIMNKLHLSIDFNPDDYFSYIKVFYVNDLPVRYAKSFLNKNLFTNNIDVEKIKKSLIEYLEENSIKPFKLTSIIEAKLKDQMTRNLLVDNHQDYVICRYSILYDKNNNIIEITQHTINLDHFETSSIKYL
ncbi:GntR family transcriptional regulator [Mycoplasma capricolum subsp. capricolum]|uniref:GntR family transcriptional regulator n=1 Tax=Mycoplasma capricolum TaxID=2095 RepID=UPI003DA4815F